MNRLFLLRLLLLPSFFSGFAMVILAVVFLSLINAPFAIENPVVAHYFFGSDGVITQAQVAVSNPFQLFFTALSADLTYTMGVGIIAILVALLVYVLLESFDHSVLGVISVVRQIHDADKKSKTAIEREIGTHVAVRVLAIIAWCFYWVVFMNVILPFCILSTRITLDRLTFNQLLFALVGVLILFLSLHVHVILLRLVMLRPRVFGVLDVILARKDT